MMIHFFRERLNSVKAIMRSKTKLQKLRKETRFFNDADEIIYVVEHNKDDEKPDVYPLLCFKDNLTSRLYLNPHGNPSIVVPATVVYVPKLVAIHKPRCKNTD